MRTLDGETGDKGWNQLVTALSGGYLEGHEVERPRDVLPQRARRGAPARVYADAMERRRAILALLVEGKTQRETAEALGVSPRTVGRHAKRLREEYGVKRSKELRAKLGPWQAPKITTSTTGAKQRA